MSRTLTLDLKVKEALNLSHEIGHQHGVWDALSSVHRMLESMGYGMDGEIGIRIRDLSRELGAPISHLGDPYDENDWAAGEEIEEIKEHEDDGSCFARVHFQGVDYIYTPEGWKVMGIGIDSPRLYKPCAYANEEMAEAKAEAFLSYKQKEG